MHPFETQILTIKPLLLSSKPALEVLNLFEAVLLNRPSAHSQGMPVLPLPLLVLRASVLVIVVDIARLRLNHPLVPLRILIPKIVGLVGDCVGNHVIAAALVWIGPPEAVCHFSVSCENVESFVDF